MPIHDIMDFYSEIKEFPVLCRSCGMCEGVCPTGAVKMTQNEYSQFIPTFDPQKCTLCCKCMATCTARRIVRDEPAIIGSYRKICLIRATDSEIAEKSTSGGAVTALLKFGLENGYFNQVLTQSNENSPICAEPVIKTEITADDSGSKYVCAPLGVKYSRKFKNTAATVLPCQAQSIRRLENDTFLFGLFCSKLSTPDLIRRMAGKKNLPEITKTAYRDGTWPGKFSIRYKNGKVYEQKLNRSVFGAVYNSYLYTCQGCMLCDDYFAEYADISCGDPWGKPQYDKNYTGQTVTIIRSERAMKLVEEAEKAGVIEIEEYDYESLIKGHLKELYHKKTAIIQRLRYVKSKMHNHELAVFNEQAMVYVPYSRTLNKFSIYTNFVVKEKGRYESTFRFSKHLLFLIRYSHTLLMKRKMKKGLYFPIYRAIASNEKVED